MKFKTIIAVFLLLSFQGLESCGGTKPEKAPATVEQSEKILAKKKKKQARAAKKANKEAYKRYWKAQSKDARKSIKKNKKRQKRIAKHKKN